MINKLQNNVSFKGVKIADNQTKSYLKTTMKETGSIKSVRDGLASLNEIADNENYTLISERHKQENKRKPEYGYYLELRTKDDKYISHAFIPERNENMSASDLEKRVTRAFNYLRDGIAVNELYTSNHGEKVLDLYM